MKKATTPEIAAIVLAFIGTFVVLTAGATAVWLTSEVRVFGLVALPAAIVAGLVVRGVLETVSWLFGVNVR